MALSDYTKCSNGHYYKKELGRCPYCRTTGIETTDSTRTMEIEGGSTLEIDDSTDLLSGSDISTDLLSGKTEIYSENNMTQRAINDNLSSKTIIVSSTETFDQKKQVVQNQRKLVGWIVSYTLNPLGVAFSIYEGRNFIGRDFQNDIVINEPTVSSKHAVILFKNGRFFVQDLMSSNGTYVNDEELELNFSQELKENDIIKFGKGKAIFKFKSAI